MPFDGGHVPTPGWKWPGKNPIPAELAHEVQMGLELAIAQLRRDRDDLVEALERAIEAIPAGTEIDLRDRQVKEMRALLARVKAR